MNNNIEIGSTLILEDNSEYICFDKLNYNNEIYLYLSSVQKPVKVTIAKVDTNSSNITIIGNKQEKNILHNLFKQQHSKE